MSPLCRVAAVPRRLPPSWPATAWHRLMCVCTVQALPVIMGGRDCIGVAKTGSGKVYYHRAHAACSDLTVE
jgi:hypothetical protein